jgi:hypothetical protein
MVQGSISENTERDFCLFKDVQTDTGTRPASHAVYRWLCRGLPEADSSRSFSAEFKNEWEPSL